MRKNPLFSFLCWVNFALQWSMTNLLIADTNEYGLFDQKFEKDCCLYSQLNCKTWENAQFSPINNSLLKSNWQEFDF